MKNNIFSAGYTPASVKKPIIEQPPASEDLLTRIGQCAAKLSEQDSIVADLSEQLKRAEDTRKEIARDILPTLMDEAMMTSFTLESGAHLDVVTKVSAKIKEDQRDGAMQWLDDNGHGGIIKGEVKVTVPRDQKDVMTAIEQLLAGGLDQGDVEECINKINTFSGKVSVKEDVHPSTLKSFVKEVLEADDGTFPRDMFGVFEFREIKIKDKR